MGSEAVLNCPCNWLLEDKTKFIFVKDSVPKTLINISQAQIFYCIRGYMARPFSIFLAHHGVLKKKRFSSYLTENTICSHYVVVIYRILWLLKLNIGLFLDAFTKLRKATTSVVMSVCLSVLLSVPSVRPHGTTRLLLDGFSWNLIFEVFRKICLEN